MYIQLEDEFGDIVGKARRGREMSVADLAEKTAIAPGDIERLEDYEWTPGMEEIEGLAEVLALEIRRQLLGTKRSAMGPRLLPPLRSAVPPPERTLPVPKKYHRFIGKHHDHPGEGRGPGCLGARRIERRSDD